MVGQGGEKAESRLEKEISFSFSEDFNEKKEISFLYLKVIFFASSKDLEKHISFSFSKDFKEKMEIFLVLEGDLFRVVKGPGEGDLLLVHERSRPWPWLTVN